ncbi:MAG: guanylate kinase [Desulfobacterota bacterium]|nr:guanylate kinase [Thermodesulfobacteriota bacterium]
MRAYQKHLLFVVSAPSGSGKTSLCTQVLTKVENLRFSISHTTRRPRPGEVHGVHYYFVSREEFQDMITRNLMAEWTEIYGNLYGTARQTIEAACAAGDDLLFDIDGRGGRQLVDAYSNVVTILILPPSLEQLRQRLIGRGTENKDSLTVRLEQARAEIRQMAWYSYIIINDDFDRAVEELASIIRAERCRHRRDVIAHLLEHEQSNS